MITNLEYKRRTVVSWVLKDGWKIFKRIGYLTFSDSLRLSWALVKGQTRIIKSKARGVMFNNENGVSRQRILARLATYPESDIYLYFQRDYNNSLDTNAIKIITEVKGKGAACVGYLSADLAKEVALIMDDGYEIAAYVLEITGIGKKNLGVNFCFVILPIPTYHNKQKSPQMAC